MVTTCAGIRGPSNALEGLTPCACGAERGAERWPRGLRGVCGPLIIRKYVRLAGSRKAGYARGRKGRGYSACGRELGQGCAPRADAADSRRRRPAGRGPMDVPPALSRPSRAVCVRLAEMVADQRHYLAPLPEPQETERSTVLTLVAERLRTAPVTRDTESLPPALAR